MCLLLLIDNAGSLRRAYLADTPGVHRPQPYDRDGRQTVDEEWRAGFGPTATAATPRGSGWIH